MRSANIGVYVIMQNILKKLKSNGYRNNFMSIL